MYDKSKKYSFYPAHMFTNEQGLELGELMVEIAPGEMKNHCKIWLTCTGTDSTDDAIRLARQHFMERGISSKFIFVSRWQSFHGNNIYYIEGIGGHTLRRTIFNPMCLGSHHIFLLHTVIDVLMKKHILNVICCVEENLKR